MIEFETGDLLAEDAEALVNTVNCVGVMGRGIALQLKRAFPESFRSYAVACQRDDFRPDVRSGAGNSGDTSSAPEPRVARYDRSMSDPGTPRPRPHWQDTLVALRWPLTLVVLVSLVALAVYSMVRATLDLGERAVRAPADTVERIADRAADIAERFRTGTITETFRSALPTIDRSPGGLLEVGTLETVETFERSDERRVLWDAISLGTTVSEIQVPVTYRYHVRLDGNWRLEVDEHTCRVVAPAILPTLPPAIHTEGLEKRSAEGWLRFDGEEQLSELEKGITPRLRQMAGDPRRIALVRESARRTVAEMVRTWLLREDHWGGDRFRMIQVGFEDEVLEDIRHQPITLALEEPTVGPPR